MVINDYTRPTRYFIHASESPHPLRLAETPRPRLVYRRSRHSGEVEGGDARWIVAYATEFVGNKAPVPARELAAVVELTPDALKLAYDGKLTIGILNRMRDGSKIRKRPGLVLDPKLLLTPAGVAQIVAASMYGGEADWV